jgi:3-hydroxyisobutyrate dehydrogenase-like beta-hydroxyacid dehydrogenase
VFADLNAIAPQTAGEIAGLVVQGGASFVDGGIIGPPGGARLYLCGDQAKLVAELFRGSSFEATTIDGGPGAASALKACYAAWTKGSDALLLAIRALARAEGVEVPLLAEWARSQSGLVPASERAVRANARKAWRFVGEMDQIAETFAAAGLPDGFHRAAAAVFARLRDYKDAPQPPALDEALRTLSPDS